MGGEVIAHRQMADDIFPVGTLENVHLVGSVIAALSHIPSAGNTEFTHIFITEFYEPFPYFIHLFKIVNHGHNVYYRFGCKSRNRGTPDMIYCRQVAV